MNSSTYDREIRERAVGLRKSGKSYSEILKEIPVAKSTLSLWLRDVGLSKRQKHILTERKREAGKRGGMARRNQRIATVKRIHQEALRDINKITKRELWLIGVMLYWAEGSKEKEYQPGSGVNFTNSDPRMISLFLMWLKDTCLITANRISLDIYIHLDRKDKLQEIIKYWANVTDFPENHFTRIYFKKGNRNTNRKNIGDNYFGILRVKVLASSDLNRRIAGWINGVVEYLA